MTVDDEDYAELLDTVSAAAAAVGQCHALIDRLSRRGDRVDGAVLRRMRTILGEKGQTERSAMLAAWVLEHHVDGVGSS